MMENENGREKRFVVDVLPWLVGAAALAVYLGTLNHWLSFFNMGPANRITGWQWNPELQEPLYFLITLPLRWLPEKVVPIAINLLSAVFAALAIGQLARSTALLPHDRTHDQRLREKDDYSLFAKPLSWLPPLIAAMACGLQLTFWEHATNGSPEMLNLFIFSFVVRELLEFRIEGRDPRLVRLAFVYGLGMANDVAFIGFFPLFLAALLWIRGLAFFNFRFLARMFLWGLLGLAFSLLLPFLASRSEIQSLPFWASFKINFLAQKNLFFQFPPKTFVLLCVSSLIPVFLISIRWASHFGDSSRLGTAMATLMFHAAHALLLFVCIWAAFDPPISPRQKGFGMPFLSFYYLGALSIGYFSGYFLLVFNHVPPGLPAPLLRLADRLATALVVIVAVLVPSGLLLKNAQEIRTTNGPILKQFAAAIGEGLPEKGILLGDDPRYVILARTWLLENGRGKNCLSLDTSALKFPGYQRLLKKKFPDRWTMEDAHREQLLSPPELISLVARLSETNTIYYLQPSFGYYFEFFYLEPHGLVYKLNRYSTNSVLPPPVTPGITQENEAFWASLSHGRLDPILAVTAPMTEDKQTQIPFRAKFLKKAKIPVEHNALAMGIGACYSRALNYWGVEMQKQNELEKAAKYFQFAVDLKPDNVVAEINLKCNTQLRANQRPELVTTKSIEDLFGKYHSWTEILDMNGPYDEPSFCYAESDKFFSQRLFRQAAQLMDRVCVLSPNEINSRLVLAEIHLVAKLPDKALEYTGEIRRNLDNLHPTRTNLVELTCLEATAHFMRHDSAKGLALLKSLEGSAQNEPTTLSLIVAVFMSQGLYTNALAVIGRQLELDPSNSAILVNQGYAYCQTREFDKAIVALTKVINVFPENQNALLDRAIAYLNNNQLEESKADYQKLQQIESGFLPAYFGLAEIALRNKDTNSAIQNYEAGLTNTFPGSPQAKQIQFRLKELKGEKGK